MNAGAHAGSPWSPHQRYLLQALGHVVPRLAGAEEAPAAAVEEEVARTPMQARAAPAVDRGDAAAAPRRRAPAGPGEAQAPAAPPAVPPPPRHGGMRRPAALPDRLQLAVLRASGLAPTDPRVQALLAEWPSTRLRGDAAAKRALWPLLRALRRPA